MKSLIILPLLVIAAATTEFRQDCTNALDGLYPLGSCETQFLTCSGGIDRIMDCPADLVYNANGEFCDWRENVPGCVGSGGSGEASGEGSGESSGEGSGEASGEGSGEASGEGSGESSGEGSGETSGEGSGETSGEGSGEGSGLEDLLRSGDASGEASGLGDFLRFGDASGEASGLGDFLRFGDASGEGSGLGDLLRSGDASEEASGLGDLLRFGDASGEGSGLGDLLRSGDASGEASGLGDLLRFGDASGEGTGADTLLRSGEGSGLEDLFRSGDASGEASGLGNLLRFGAASGEGSGLGDLLRSGDSSGEGSGVDTLLRSVEGSGIGDLLRSGDASGDGSEIETLLLRSSDGSGDASVEGSSVDALLRSGEGSGLGDLLRSGDASGDSSEIETLLRSADGSGDAFAQGSVKKISKRSVDGSGNAAENGLGLASDNVCADLEDGAYHFGGCTTFYFFCSSNTKHVLSCPTPLFYDSQSQRCSWKLLVEDCQNEVVVIEESGDNSGEGSGSENSGEGSGSESSGEGSGSDNSGEGSGDIEPTCDGRPDGIFAISKCATNFLTCSGGVARLMDCPASLVFNPEISVCDWPHSVSGCSGSSTPRPVCEEDGYFSFGQCSSSFTACTNGRPIIMFCPDGLAFSQQNQMCDYPLAVQECEGSSGEESGESSGESSGEGSGESSGEGSGEASGEGSGESSGEGSGEYSGEGSGESSGQTVSGSCENLNNGLYSLGCTSSVLSCQNGHEDIFQCPSGLVFNEQSFICDYPQTSIKCLLEDVPLLRGASPTFDCSTSGSFSGSLCSSNYHQCIEGRLVNFTCDDINAVFSVSDGNCVSIQSLPQCQ